MDGGGEIKRKSGMFKRRFPEASRDTQSTPLRDSSEPISGKSHAAGLTLTPAICKKAHAGFAADRQHLHYLRYYGSQGQCINLKKIY